jgi:hypothetical protein
MNHAHKTENIILLIAPFAENDYLNSSLMEVTYGVVRYYKEMMLVLPVLLLPLLNGYILFSIISIVRLFSCIYLDMSFCPHWLLSTCSEFISLPSPMPLGYGTSF